VLGIRNEIARVAEVLLVRCRREPRCHRDVVDDELLLSRICREEIRREAVPRLLEDAPLLEKPVGHGMVRDHESVVRLRAQTGHGPVGAAGQEDLRVPRFVAEHRELVVRKVSLRNHAIGDGDSRGFQVCAHRRVLVGLLRREGTVREHQVGLRAEHLERRYQLGIIELV
jgi:hypothetical protein